MLCVRLLDSNQGLVLRTANFQHGSSPEIRKPSNPQTPPDCLHYESNSTLCHADPAGSVQSVSPQNAEHVCYHYTKPDFFFSLIGCWNGGGGWVICARGQLKADAVTSAVQNAVMTYHFHKPKSVLALNVNIPITIIIANLKKSAVFLALYIQFRFLKHSSRHICSITTRTLSHTTNCPHSDQQIYFPGH